ncbi:bifunctional oligoribonuclease/PAP phosphatase NrnA [Candidatus Berkelbacteria bacterium]|nr:bifunctional oligoribonuclease/PAP phosphatase NrnA [Candidatus Berkelbacteria bacterium]
MSHLATAETAAPLLRQAERVLILCHQHPDGDTLGGGLGLARMLQQLGKLVTVTCCDDIPRPFRFLPGIETVLRDCLLGSYDLIVIVDCGDLKRTGLADRIGEFRPLRSRILNIDHHQRNNLHKVAGTNYVDFDASSASELVFRLIEPLGVRLEPDMATCILAGLYNDTGGFKHSNTSPAVLEQAAVLLAADARLSEITDHMANFKSVPALKLWGVALTRLQYHESLAVVTSLITQADLDRCQAYLEDLAGCVNLINSVPKARAAILLAELPDGRIKGSLRTESSAVNVADLAGVFGGGGIRKAAGFSLSGRFAKFDDQWQIVMSETQRPKPVSNYRLPMSRPLTLAGLQPILELGEEHLQILV